MTYAENEEKKAENVTSISSPAKVAARPSYINADGQGKMFVAVNIVIAFVAYVFAQGLNGTCNVTTQHLSDPPYENYFYSDCNLDAQAVVTSPLTDSNLTIIGPRLIIAWPAGNSGVCTFFQPQSGQNGSLAIALVNSTVGTPLAPVYTNSSTSEYPHVGVEGVLSFNASATLTIAILGSVRTIRDFTEGPSILQPTIQSAIAISSFNGTGAVYSRMWLDNVTTTTFALVPYENQDSKITVGNDTVSFGAGFYRFSATLDYPQLTQLPPTSVLNDASQDLIARFPAETTSLSFLSYTEKLLAGAWRFLTYFGRDSMISALLLEPVLSSGNGSALEAVIGAVLERINRTDGSVCHEETIGDYATFLNLQNNITSTAPTFTYPMIDTDYFLSILMASYSNASPSRIKSLLDVKAGSVDEANQNLTWGDLAYINAQRIMNITAAFGDNPTVSNLIHLKEDQIVGNWRDSTYGLANGRIPFDVNCALVPAALYAIASLAEMPGVYPINNITANWSSVATRRAKAWEDHTLSLFEYTISAETASSRLEQFTNESTFYSGPSQAEALSNYSHNGVITSYALAINSSEDPHPIPVDHTDTGFRLFFLNSTNSTQLTTFINSTANSILRPFPAGLTTPVGQVVANAALSGSSVLIANFTNSAYHGTVVWSWQLALMAKGLERQLARCDSTASPTFCNDTSVLPTVLRAYNVLWDTIEANSGQLQSEVWSWTYANETGYREVPLGSLPPPPGVSSGTESDIRQLWSLAFLAVTRNTAYV